MSTGSNRDTVVVLLGGRHTMLREMMLPKMFSG